MDGREIRAVREGGRGAKRVVHTHCAPNTRCDALKKGLKNKPPSLSLSLPVSRSLSLSLFGPIGEEEEDFGTARDRKRERPLKGWRTVPKVRGWSSRRSRHDAVRLLI